MLKRWCWLMFCMPLWCATLNVVPEVYAADAVRAKSVNSAPKKPSRWSWNYGLSTSLSWSLGNLDQLTWHSSGQLSVSSLWFGLRSRISYQLGYLDGAINRNDLLFGVGASILPRAPTAVDVVSLIETNALRKIQSRLLLGLGSRFTLLRRAGHTIRLGAYVAYLATQYQTSDFASSYGIDGSSTQLPALRTVLDGRHEIVARRWRLSYRLAFLSSLLPNVVHTQVGGALHNDVALWGAFALRLSVLYTYESILQRGTRPHDLLLLFGLRIQPST